jgi:hypothetical protein
VQSDFAGAVMRPLTADWGMQPTTPDGRDMREHVATFIKPNDRLTSFERLELYNKQYWFRLIDCMYEDYPGLGAIMGEENFRAMLERYFVLYPSRSTLLRNLGDKLEAFIQDEPQWFKPNQKMALDMARFEWAQVVAFDGPAKKPLTPDDLLGKDPSTMRIGLQPYLTVLSLNYPLDEFVVAVKKQAMRGDASNATDGFIYQTKRRRLPKPKKICLAIHRVDNTVFIKRMPVEACMILKAIQDGATISAAIDSVVLNTRKTKIDWPMRMQEWFKLWMHMGWFCRR